MMLDIRFLFTQIAKEKANRDKGDSVLILVLKFAAHAFIFLKELFDNDDLFSQSQNHLIRIKQMIISREMQGLFLPCHNQEKQFLYFELTSNFSLQYFIIINLYIIQSVVLNCLPKRSS